MTAKQLSVCLTSVANFIMSDESNDVFVSLKYTPVLGWYVSAVPVDDAAESTVTISTRMIAFRKVLESRCFAFGLPMDLHNQYTNPDSQPFQYVIY